MKHQVDKIFSNKLQNHTIQPSEAVWSKVSEGVAKKKKKGGWYLSTGIAAGLAVLLGITMLLNRDRGDGIETIQPNIEPAAIVDTECLEPKIKTPFDEKINGVEIASNVLQDKEKKGRATRIAPLKPQTIVLNTEVFIMPVERNIIQEKQKTEEVFYISFTSKDKGDKPSFKEKATDYVSEQYKKVKQGEDIELPKIPLPRLEIKLDKVFAFNKIEE